MSAMIRFPKFPFVLTLIGLLMACVPPVKQPPTPDRIAMGGDSIVWQSIMFHGDYAGFDTDEKVFPGWRASHAQPRLTQDVATVGASPDVYVFEFGHNYLTFGEAQRNEVIAHAFTPHEDTCVVIVNPHPGPNNAAVINAYRDLVGAIAATRPNTVVVDWSEIAQAHPEYLDEDGVHLETVPWDYDVPPQPSAVAFADMIHEGIANCP